jgi:hypothetical protein
MVVEDAFICDNWLEAEAIQQDDLLNIESLLI